MKQAHTPDTNPIPYRGRRVQPSIAGRGVHSFPTKPTRVYFGCHFPVQGSGGRPAHYRIQLLPHSRGGVDDDALHPAKVTCKIDRMLMLRDLLRTDLSKGDLYETTKRELAARHWTSIDDYADAKSAVIEHIMTPDGR